MAEAVLVLGVISSIISIVDGTKKVYDAATDVHGLPEAFRDVAARLPIVQNILGSVKQHLEASQVNEESCKGVKPVVGACEKKAEKLDDLFHKVIPVDGASGLKRYYKAVRAYGKGNEVEKLMKGILEDVQLLSSEHGMNTATKAQQEQLIQAITEVSAIPTSVPAQEFQETGFTANYSGSGPQYNAQGEYVAQGQARQYISGGAPMYFGDVHYSSPAPRQSDNKVITSQSLPCATPAFFGRDAELSAIKDSLLSKDPGQKVIVLTGIGGLGKTQIALQFWSVNATAYDSRLWIDATSLATVLSSFREVALALGENVALGGKDITLQPMMSVKSWLALTDNTKWLLVIDNVEDLDSDYNLQDIIPKCDHGAIILTTTQSETASVLGGVNIDVGAIGTDAGGFILRRRFKRKTFNDEEKNLTDKIIEELYGVPLAIEQAGAYLQFNPSLTTNVLKSFLAKLSSPITQADILAKIPKRSVWFYEKHRSVIATYSLLKASLARNNDDAVNILSISACLAQGEIPLLFLTQSATNSSTFSTLAKLRAIYEKLQESPSEALLWLRRITTDESAYYMALEALEQSCCIKRRLAPHESTYVGYSMHNVIRHWCRLNLHSEEQAEWTILAAFQLSQHLQLDGVSVYSHQNYSRHVGFVDEVIRDPKYGTLVKFPDGRYWWQDFVTACIWAQFYQRQRRFDLAKRMVKAIILYEKDVYDSQWPSRRESLETLHFQARIFWEEGDFSEAIQCYQDLLRACEMHLGHFDDLTATASQELKKVQDRMKQHQRDWHRAAHIKEPESLSQHENERARDHTSSEKGNLGLQLFLKRYIDPTVMGLTLHEAASSGYEAGVSYLLDNGIDIEARTRSGWTALLSAAETGQDIIVQLLLEKGADINFQARDDEGWTALLLAVKNGHKYLVQLLLSNGANIEARSFRKTVLSGAALTGYDEIIQQLLENGTDAESWRKSRWTSLLIAAENGHEGIMRLLLSKGADVEARTIDGNTALILAARLGHKTVVQLLLEQGADIKTRTNFEMTALFVAAENGHESTIQLLLERGAEIEAHTWSALFFAAKNGHEDVVQLLLEKGADIEARTVDGTALSIAAENGYEGVVRLILKKGANIRARSSEKKTALFGAALRGHESIVRLLLENGADIEACEWSALFSAAKNGHESIIRVLLEKEADIEAKTLNGGTALLIAAYEGHKAAVQLLLEAGADIEAKTIDGGIIEQGERSEVRTIDGGTALLIAAYEGHEAIVQLLLEAGADIEARSRDGRTVLELAAERCHGEIVLLLLRHQM